MNKKHWNTINLDGKVPDKEVFSWIDHSYELIKARK
jgi:predicted DNA-binding protein (MmcQ/YjbR family)